MEKLSALWGREALMLYLGAAIGFYGSRALFAWVVSPIVKKVAGEGGTGLKDPVNYKELTDIIVAALGLTFAKEPMLLRGIVAGAGLSLIDHLLARFPAVGAKVPR